MPPHVLILRAPGTNCDLETAYAFEKAGATVERLHVNRLLETPALFDKFQILCFPGGFSYGDDVASGRVLANQLHHHLSDRLMAFREAGKLMLGICNGFQILMKTGMLFPILEGQTPPATLAWNDCARFQDRWVNLETDPQSGCVFLRGIKRLYMPMAHAEGRFTTKDEKTFRALEKAGQLCLRYAPLDETPWGGNVPTYDVNGVLCFPANPNGAAGNVAGVCDETGRVLGLMPHPERHIFPTQHPRWTRETPGTLPEEGDGMKLFRNAVEYFE